MGEHAVDIEQPESLMSYLRRDGRLGADEWARARVLQGGVSNKTVLVGRGGFAPWPGERHPRSAVQPTALRPEFGSRGFSGPPRIEPYYLYAAELVPAAAPFLFALVDETRSVAATLTHGDFSPKNVLIHEGRLKLLDFEVAHIGDPAFDLGFSLAHLLSKARHLPGVRTELRSSVNLYWNAYREAIGDASFADGLEARAVRHACACLLARAQGRSQLEYLSEEEKARQTASVLRILPGPPTISELAEVSAA